MSDNTDPGGLDDPVEPTTDPAPDEAPGGADALERDPDDYPVVTPDQPRSAQLEEEDVPDAIEEPDDTGEAEPIEEAADNGPEEPA